MRWSYSWLVGSMLLLGATAGIARGGEGEARRIPLTYKVHYKWTIDLPAEQFRALDGEFPIRHTGGSGFAVQLKGTTLAIDTDGDGKSDVFARGKKSIVKLEAPRGDGSTITYAARLRYSNGWSFAASGAMTGEVDGTRVQLIDQNNNGRYDDVGKDAIVVGEGGSASLLSSVLNIGGKLYLAHVDPNGTSLALDPYTGPAGTLDLRGGFESGGTLLSAVVHSADGKYSFELSSAAGGLAVPAGSYRLLHGVVGKGRERAVIHPGKSGTITVGADAVTRWNWGGPLTATFGLRRAGDQLQFSPRELWFHGRAGEEYRAFVPEGRSPEFQVRDVNTSKDLLTAKFGVSG